MKAREAIHGLLVSGLLAFGHVDAEQKAFAAAPSDAFAEATRRLHEGDVAVAAGLYAQVSAEEGATERGMQARYRQAQALALQPGRAVEAITQFRHFLDVDAALAPPRLLEVARSELARLTRIQQDSSGWEALEALRHRLQHLSYPERVEHLEALLAKGGSEPVRQAAFQMRVEEAWFANDWEGVTSTLERRRQALGELSEAWQGVLAQAEREKRRIVLAWLASLGVGCALVAGAARFVRHGKAGTLPERKVLRVLGRLLLQWWLTLAILYGFYWLGRRTGDIGPVVLERMALLTILTSTGLGLTWWLGLELRSARALGRTWAGASTSGWWMFGVKGLLALLLNGCLLYLFCYYYDYTSVLGL